MANQQDELKMLEAEGIRWIKSERAARQFLARELHSSERSAMVPFFSSSVLDKLRVQHIAAIPNPGFYSVLRSMGIPIPIDFTQMHAITMVDCILIAESKVGAGRLPMSLLFHELVHLVQYECLGVEEFVHRYVYGWAANGKNYFGIPIEVQAYDLQRRYEASPNTSFSVEAFVQNHLPS